MFPTPKLGGRIEEYIADGRKIFSFIADFRAVHPLWKRIISGFLNSEEKNSTLLFFWGTELTQNDLIAVKDFINSMASSEGKTIYFLQPIEGKDFSTYLLRNSTHFITTREMVTLECLDWLYDTNVKIISALDDNIFENEPPVKWVEIYK